MDPLNQVRSCHLLCPKERYEKEKEHTKPAKISGQSFQFNYRIVKTSCFNENSNNLHSLFHCSKKEDTCYFCSYCNRAYHKECVESPSIYHSSDHPKHPLQLLFIKKKKKILFNFSGLSNTLIQDVFLVKHTLHYFPRKSTLACDVCGLVDDDYSHLLYTCLLCDFFVHKRCIDLPYVIKVSRHNHRLAFTPSNLFKESADCGDAFMQCTPDVHYDVMYPTGKNLKESLKDRVSNKKRYLGRTQVKTPPPLASLHAGEAFCRRRRVLCSVSHSLSISCSRRLHHRHLAEPSHRYRLPCYSLGRHRLSVSSPHHRPTSQGKQKHQIYSLRVWSRWSAHMLVLTESPLDTRPKPPLFRPFPSPVIVKVTRQVPSPPKRLVSPPTPNLEPLDENLQGFNSTDLLIGTIILLLWSTQLRWNIVSQPVPSSRPILEYHQEHLFTSATPSLPSYASPLFCIPLQLPQLLHRQIRSSTVRFTPSLRSSSLYQLLVPNPHKSLDMSFQSVAMELRFSSGLDESHGSRYGNIRVHLLSWISLCSSSCLIVKSITSHPPRRLVTPIPSESRWYSTDTCFGLNQNHLRSLNVLIIIYLSHQSSSEASCLSMVCRRASLQRVHLAQSRDVELKSPLFVHSSHVSRVSFSSEFVTGAIRVQGPAYLFVSSKSRTLLLFVSDEIHVVYSGNIEVGVRAVHARSTSFQT
ncbi:hypothetical protein YC2023_079579 [Brassica napus]